MKNKWKKLTTTSLLATTALTLTHTKKVNAESAKAKKQDQKQEVDSSLLVAPKLKDRMGPAFANFDEETDSSLLISSRLKDRMSPIS